MRITTASAHPYRRGQKLPDIGQKVSGIESRKIFLVAFEKIDFLIFPTKSRVRIQLKNFLLKFCERSLFDAFRRLNVSERPINDRFGTCRKELVMLLVAIIYMIILSN